MAQIVVRRLAERHSRPRSCRCGPARLQHKQEVSDEQVDPWFSGGRRAHAQRCDGSRTDSTRHTGARPRSRPSSGARFASSSRSGLRARCRRRLQERAGAGRGHPFPAYARAAHRIRAAIRARLTDDAREGLPAALSERIADKLGIEVQLPPGGDALAGSADQAPQRHSRAALQKRCGSGLRTASRTPRRRSPVSRPSSAPRFSPQSAQGSATRSRIGLDIPLPRRSARSCPDKTVGSGAKSP